MPASKHPSSKKQMGYMWVHHPKIAHRWARRAKRKYGKKRWISRLPRRSRRRR